jgi:hypothetical protein
VNTGASFVSHSSGAIGTIVGATGGGFAAAATSGCRGSWAGGAALCVFTALVSSTGRARGNGSELRTTVLSGLMFMSGPLLGMSAGGNPGRARYGHAG